MAPVSEKDLDLIAPQRGVTDEELLGLWLQRPVKIYGGVWASTDAVASNIEFSNPWTDWMTNSAVSRKLANHQLLRGNLHLKFVLNGSPYHQGFLGFKYFPYQENNLNAAYDSQQYVIQFPGPILNVSTDTSGEFVCPFYSQKNWIDLAPTEASGYLSTEMGRNLGVLWITPLTALSHVTEATPPPINYSVYAWMENVELAVPTPYVVETEAGFTAKKGGKTENEPESGPVSGPASTVATIASRLSGVPLIGSFAKATEIGANAVGGVAKLFGFSKPTLLDNVGVYKVGIFENHAGGIGFDTANKLSLDPKQETTIDSSVVGLTGDDDMNIMNIAQREGYVTTVTWSSTDVADTVLTQLPVAPGGYAVQTSSIDFDLIHPTPLYWLTRAFAYWTGTLVFKFKFASTRFHRGRLQIAYLPRDATILPTVDWTNVTWNTVVDVNEDNEVEVELPWTQALPWLSTKRILWSDTAFGYPESNGTLVLRVINALEDTSAAATVDIVVTVRAGDDFKVNKPYSQAIQNYYTWIHNETNLPSTRNGYGDTDYVDPTFTAVPTNQLTNPNPALTEAGFTKVESNEPTDCVNFGESMLSLRTLIKRYSHYLAVGAKDRTSDLYGFTLPAHPFDARRVVTSFRAPTTPGWWTNNQTFYTYFRSGFVGLRGGSRYRMFLVDDEKGSTTDDVHVNFLANSVRLVDVGAPFVDEFNSDENFYYADGNGSALSVTHVNGGMECEVPYYSQLNFIHGSAADDRYGLATAGAYASLNSVFAHFQTPHRTGTGGWDHAGRVYIYSAAAEDATFEWFLAAPPLMRPIAGRYGRDATAT